MSIRAGLVRGKSQQQLDKAKAKAKAAKSNDTDTGDAEAEPDGPSITQALLTDITAAQGEALAEALAQTPALAVRIAAAALMANAGWNEFMPVRIKTDGMVRPWQQNEDRPKSFADALELVPQANALSVLAVELGRAIDVRNIKFKTMKDGDPQALVELFPAATYLKAMRGKFDAADYFTRASAKVAIAALEDMGVTEFDAKEKKAVLASLAGEQAAQRGWLPEELRCAGYALLTTKAKKKAA